MFWTQPDAIDCVLLFSEETYSTIFVRRQRAVDFTLLNIIFFYFYRLRQDVL